MGNVNATGVSYGNWVSAGLIRRSFGMSLVFALLYLLVHFLSAGMLVFLEGTLLVLAVFFFVCFVYFIYARHLFSYSGGGIQGKIVDRLISLISWDGNGKVLDIGSGSGALALKLAKKFSGAAVTGIDYWGKGWEYSKRLCEENAEAEGVSGRTAFLQASASSLPFENGSFDLVVSNMVFHEVKDTGNKAEVIKEALRVVKKGGAFAFQDLFLWKAVYGDIDSLLKQIEGWGVREVRFVDTSKSDFIPPALKLPFMIGPIGILYGVK